MTIKVTPAQLSDLSGKVAKGSGDISGTLSGLSSQVAPLVAGEWGGQAAGAFHQMYETWQRSAQQLNEALEGISRLLGQASTSYADAETRIAASFAS